MTGDALPPRLASIVEDFQQMAQPERLQLLLEFADGLPPLPARYADDPELLEPVAECQSPVFLTTEVDAVNGTGADPLDATVHVFFSAPREAPTTRGFAGILAEGLDGLTAREIIALPPDVGHRLGLDQAVSPLRMRGLAGMIGRIKRQVTEKVSRAA